MSSNVEREWFYYLKGRHILLYQLLSGSSSERITQSGVIRTREKELMYPNEDIADGLRIEYTALNEPFVSESLETTTATASGTDISFALSGTRITTDNTNNFWDTTSGFVAGDKIRVQGSASNDADYTIDSFSGGGNSNMVVSGSTLTDENAGESVTIYQIPKEDSSPSESSHVNLSRMLSLACVDYVKAMLSDFNGELDKKEYYMREFWKKIGDNESNRRMVAMSFPMKSYSVI